MNLCINCNHHQSQDGVHRCHSPEQGTSPVDGLPVSGYCSVLRGFGCGPEGAWFSAIHAELPKDYAIFPTAWEDPEPSFGEQMREVKR